VNNSNHLPNDLIEFYDKLAKNYFELYGEEQLKKWQEIIYYLNSKFTREEMKKLKIIDLGCGVGILNLKEIFGFSIGIDISFESLKLAKNKYNLLVNTDLNKICLRKNNIGNYLIISVSALQNLNEKAIKKILSLKNKQIHSVMYRGKGEKYWKDLFFSFKFKLVKKENNDLIFSNF
jgi:ubiquinone/menaquinone biosynthesis C-methylase UbiE